ncbi:MAG TPA: ATPase, T2SS/T4P/T4SS family, partial [Candidatus Elarobacter sp.]|nr:ATPase, T2SS/T4P/T4SS family [Candidatus Elarobacter sp.]
RIGLTFAAGLRAVLRQDPDVILVGEIRDRETAEIAMQAALTGHLVFSTLHTNDAPGAMTRLVDMGVEPFLIASSVLAVLAQRLLRRVCDGCAVAGRPADDEGRAGRALGDAAPEVLRHAGPGCVACRGTGYRGRTAIHELLVVDDPVRTLVMARADAAQVRRHATAAGMATLRDDGCAKARAGLTTVAEVLRVTQDEG